MLTQTKAVGGILKRAQTLNAAKGRMEPAEMLDGFLKLRGTGSALIDVIDGLLLRAESDDIADGDHEDLTAELDAIRDWACGLA